MTDFSIRDIITKVQDGIIRIPTFQRGFVWESDTVAFFMDSIYKNYPFGTIQLWRTREKLKTEKNLGPFELFERDDQYPIDYVLDGQQRITSIFGVFQTDIKIPDDTEILLRFILIIRRKQICKILSFFLYSIAKLISLNTSH